MISEKMYELGSKRSTIRELFEFGNQRAAVVGRENVFDFSLGNPNVPPPPAVDNAIRDLLAQEGAGVHAYTSAQGDLGVRETIARSLNRRFGMDYTANNLYMTCGAAASLTICFKAMACPGDNFIAFAPFFPEYKCFVEGVGVQFRVVPADPVAFQIDFAALDGLIDEHTKGIIVNSPNNPCGAVYTEATIQRLAGLLQAKSRAFGHPIYLISDEPYRELVYDGAFVPYLPNYYDNAVVCYSFSKSLSLPGERIGYIAIPSRVEDSAALYAAVCGAGRVLGYVCAPSLLQRVAARCCDLTADVAVYQRNRDLLYNCLADLGFSCVKPQGAFYLFPRSLEPDARAFSERAKRYELLLVPGDDFGCPGHVRISYCVATDTIERSLPLFEKLAREYR